MNPAELSLLIDDVGISRLVEKLNARRRTKVRIFPRRQGPDDFLLRRNFKYLDCAGPVCRVVVASDPAGEDCVSVCQAVGSLNVAEPIARGIGLGDDVAVMVMPRGAR